MKKWNEKKRWKWKQKTMKKEYILVTLLVEQEIWPEACWHKSFIPSQFKFPFDFNELYQSIKISWSLGSVALSPISKKINK